LAPQLLRRCRLSFVYILPIGIKSAAARHIFLIQACNTPAAAQIVSSFPIRASTVLVASSTMSIRQPADHALPANHENCRPTAPVPKMRFALSAQAMFLVFSVADSITVLPTSNAANVS